LPLTSTIESVVLQAFEALTQPTNQEVAPGPALVDLPILPPAPTTSPARCRSCGWDHPPLRQKIWNARYETHGGNAR
jgi:hypothetical protein